VIALALSYVDRQMLSVLAPTITKALGIDDAAYGWLSAAFSIAYFASAPVAGVLVDRFGARRSLPAAVVVWSIVAALHAVAPGFAVLLALRLLLGVTESPSFSAGVQIVRRALPADAQPRAMSTLFVGMSLGGMIAPPLAIAVASSTSWRWGFVVTGALGAAWLPLWWLLSRPTPVREALDAGGLEARPSLTEAARHPAMLRAIVGVLAVMPMSAFMLSWESKFYVAQTGLSQRDLAPYLMTSALLFDLGALAIGDVAARRTAATMGKTDHRALFGVALSLTLAGPLALSVAHTPVSALFGMALAALGRGALIPLVVTDALARMPKRIAAAAGGVHSSVHALAAIVVNPIVGVAVKHAGYVPVVVAIAMCAVLPGIAWLAWHPPPRESEETPDAVPARE
jgi:predicted MFS family arabinose efflux permease